MKEDHLSGAITAELLREKLQTLVANLNQWQDKIITACKDAQFDAECKIYKEIMSTVRYLQEKCLDKTTKDTIVQKAEIELVLPKLISQPSTESTRSGWSSPIFFQPA